MLANKHSDENHKPVETALNSSRFNEYFSLRCNFALHVFVLCTIFVSYFEPVQGWSKEGQKIWQIPEVMHHRGKPNMNFFHCLFGISAGKKKQVQELKVGLGILHVWHEMQYEYVICIKGLDFRKVARWLHQQVLPDIDHRVFAFASACVGSLLPLGTASQLSAVTVHRRSQTHFGCGSHSENPPTFLPDRCNQRKKRWLADAAIFQDQAMKVVEIWCCLRFFPPFKFNGDRKRVKFLNDCLQNNHESWIIYYLLEAWKAWFFPLMSQNGFMVQLDSNTWGVRV